MLANPEKLMEFYYTNRSSLVTFSVPQAGGVGRACSCGYTETRENTPSRRTPYPAMVGLCPRTRVGELRHLCRVVKGPSLFRNQESERLSRELKEESKSIRRGGRRASLVLRTTNDHAGSLGPSGTPNLH